MVRYSGEPAANLRPPPCGMVAVAFFRSKLASGAAGKTRRPRPSRTSESWSKAGSNPSKLILKPFWPIALPWHPPALQPCFEKIGTTSVANETGRLSAKSSTTTSTLDSCPSALTRTVVRPSDRGRMRPSAATSAMPGSSLEYVAARVTSRSFDELVVAVARTCAEASEPRRTVDAGSTANPSNAAIRRARVERGKAGLRRLLRPGGTPSSRDEASQ